MGDALPKNTVISIKKEIAIELKKIEGEVKFLKDYNGVLYYLLDMYNKQKEVKNENFK